MSRLRAAPSRLVAQPARLGPAPGDERGYDQQRNATRVWRAWYRTARWYALRKDVLLRDAYACRMCGRVIGLKGEAAVDHIKRHHGDAKLFWDINNLQTLCSPCHSGEKQRQERSAE